MHAIAWAAKASFSSTRSSCPAASSARASALRVAGTGPRPMQLGSTPATAVATMRASGVRPSSAMVSWLATASAAAPSLIPLEVPAVTVPPATNAGFNRARPSRVTSGLGGSSRQTVSVVPPRRTGMPMISPSNAPAAIAAAARRWLSTANLSCSSRPIPYIRPTRSAVSPSEIVHSARIFGFTNRHPTVLSATTGAARSHGVPDLRVTYGARVMLSTPPAMNRSPSPARIACAALTTACNPEPHSRFTVWPGTSIGRPASKAAIRATLRLSSPA